MILGAHLEQPEREVYFRTDWPTLPDGGVEAIAAWLDAHPGAGMVIIDTMAKFRGASGAEGYNYQDDANSLTALHRLANDRRVAIVLVHHQNKGDHSDVFDTVSGTVGLTGVADATLVLTKGKNNIGRLRGVGRDLPEDIDVQLVFEGAKWHRYTLTIVDAVRDLMADGVEREPSTIAEDIEHLFGERKSANTIRTTCRRLVESGFLAAGKGKGCYVKAGVV